MNNLTQIYNRLIELKKIKAYAVRNNKNNLAFFCDNQIRLINRINISNKVESEDSCSFCGSNEKVELNTYCKWLCSNCDNAYGIILNN